MDTETMIRELERVEEKFCSACGWRIKWED